MGSAVDCRQLSVHCPSTRTTACIVGAVHALQHYTMVNTAQHLPQLLRGRILLLAHLEGLDIVAVEAWPVLDALWVCPVQEGPQLLVLVLQQASIPQPLSIACLKLSPCTPPAQCLPCCNAP